MGLGPARPCSLLEVGLSVWESAAPRRPRKPSCGNRNPNVTFPVFGHLMITERSNASCRKSPIPYLGSRLLHCNDHFSHLSPLSFIHSSAIGHLLF